MNELPNEHLGISAFYHDSAAADKKVEKNLLPLQPGDVPETYANVHSVLSNGIALIIKFKFRLDNKLL